MSEHPDRSRPLLVLVDAHALLHQLYHAVAPMTAPDGRPTNAVFGFARDLFYFRDEVQPDYLVYVFDPPGPVFRDQIAPDYKAQRKPPDDDLIAQIPLIEQLLDGACAPKLCIPGYEADDVIATLARAGEKQGFDVVICSSDKDMRQLVNERIRILNLRKQVYLDPAAILADWGVTPEQAIDYQTLVGDSVDNVKGVKGVGEKTAAKLLQKFGSIDNMLGHMDQLEGVVSAKIQANIKDAVDSKALEIGRKLVTLDTAVPVAMDWDKWRRPEWNAQRLLELFQEWGMRSFAGRMRTAAAAAPTPPSTSSPGSEPDLFSGVDTSFDFGANVTAAAPAWSATQHLVNTPALWQSFLKDLKRQRRFALDLLATGDDPMTCDLIGLAFCWQASESYYVPVRGPAGEPLLDWEIILRDLKPLLEDGTIFKVNQNIKFERSVLRRLGIALDGIAGDCMVADYLLHASERGHELYELSLRHLQHKTVSLEDIIGKRGKNQTGIAQAACAEAARYAGEHADAALRLCDLLEPQLERDGLRSLYEDLEVPLIEVLGEIEFTGIRLDVPFLKKLSDEMAGQLTGIESEIYRLAGREFNIASPKQLGQVLFDELNLPVMKKTDLTGAASTAQETLEKLAAQGHALPTKIMEHRQISKLKGTYVDALPALVNPATGRLHTRFNQTVAVTGRLSSSDPNLQNIPARTEQGKQIRQAFLPAEGWVLLSADYSQIELRMLAHFCGDETLRLAFAEDRDIHAAVASQIFGVPQDQVTSQHRRMAKVVNFGVIYGISAHGLAQRLGMPRDEAVTFIDQYFQRYPKVLQYQQDLLTRCRKQGYGSTILGRRRKFDPSAIRPHSTYKHRNQAEREAINMEIQGSAADLIKQAMLNIHRRLRNEQRASRMLLTVHDELVFESPRDEVRSLAELVSDEMARAMTLEVPLKVDVATGPNWLDTK